MLADNTAQNRVLGVSRHHAVPMLSVHARLIDHAGRSPDGWTGRWSSCPTHAQIAARIAAGEGLTSPELSVLVAYVKSALTAAMLDATCPTIRRSPSGCRTTSRRRCAQRYGGAIVSTHPLAREIVTTMTVNEVVNGAGITYAFRLGEEMAAIVHRRHPRVRGHHRRCSTCRRSPPTSPPLDNRGPGGVPGPP